MGALLIQYWFYQLMMIELRFMNYGLGTKFTFGRLYIQVTQPSHCIDMLRHEMIKSMSRQYS